MERVRSRSDVSKSPAPRERAEPASTEGRGVFQGHLAEAHTGQVNQQIDEAIKRIDELGARLADSLSISDLKRYREAFASLFRDLMQQMVQVQTHMEWDSQSWEHRTMVTIKKVDNELERLSEMLLSQEKDRFAILEKMGEIRGMLLDVRM